MDTDSKETGYSLIVVSVHPLTAYAPYNLAQQAGFFVVIPGSAGMVSTLLQHYVYPLYTLCLC